MNTTDKLVEEAIRRAERLQTLAFNASSGFLDDDSPYFMVSREYYSGLFYGFLTNIPFASISKIASGTTDRAGKPEGDIVQFFRDMFSRSFERPGPLRSLSDLLNSDRTDGISAIELSFDHEGNPVGARPFGSSWDLVSSISPSLSEKLVSEDLRDQKLAEVAAEIAAAGGLARDMATGSGKHAFELIVAADEHVSSGDPIRRPPMQLMQIVLRIGASEDVERWGSALSTRLQAVLMGSRVAAYSVLYERERYFEKSIRQSTEGTMIKWGDKDSITVFRDQIEALNKSNRDYPTHAAPYVLRYGIDSELQRADEKNVDKEAHYPWYEMVRYSLPSLDSLLTTTAGLRDFEVRAIAGSVFGHLETHFWRFRSVGDRGACYQGIPMAAIPHLIFVTLRKELAGVGEDEGFVAKVDKRLREWRAGRPIQVEGKGLTIPTEPWDSTLNSLWSCFLDNDIKLRAELFGDAHGDRYRFPMDNPDSLLESLISVWDHAEDTGELDVPMFLASDCHGDPHFENVFIDASIPEDPFIVMIDPIKRTYKGDPAAGRGLSQLIAREMIDSFGRQPMHDVAKLLLSTTGGYALALKGGFVGKFAEFGQTNELTYSLGWQSRDTVRPLGADTTGVSGAKLFVRSVSVAPDAERYQPVFSEEILRRFDRLVDSLMTIAGVSAGPDKIVCRNIYYLQIWAWLVRNTFSMSEKLFPERHRISDQLLVFGGYLLSEGISYLKERGPSCLPDQATHVFFRSLLSLHDVMRAGRER